jgi:hypothetical protein
MSLSVKRIDGMYAVYDGAQRVTTPVGERQLAQRALEREERRRRGRERSCLTCRATFWSSGPGHRMCNDCRLRCAGLDNQMVG